jgi:glycosyltransferase involved in cell wall biosynthesis
MPAGVLYLSYDGLLEPLGQSQVLAYLKRLAGQRPIHVISFEKAEDWRQLDRRKALAREISAAGIHWHPLRYHKRPSALATAWDIFQGTSLALWLVLRHRLAILHARSYVAAVMALGVQTVTHRRFLFDMRGFWADERVDGGLWPAAGRLYRVAKWFERRFLRHADAVVSLSHAAVREMATWPSLRGVEQRFVVITTCADLSRFQPATHRDSNRDSITSPPQPFTLGYVGSVGTWYRFDDALRAFELLRERLPNARLRIVNRGEHEQIRRQLQTRQLPDSAVSLEEADHDGVVRAMQQMDAGIFLIKPAYSKIASAPTKLGEFLGCGVPCLGNHGVGDMAEVLEASRVGVALEQFSDEALRNGIDRLLALCQDPDVRTRCRQVAEQHFSLEDGVRHYEQLYQSLTHIPA